MFVRFMSLCLTAFPLLGCQERQAPQSALPPGFTDQIIEFKGIPLGKPGVWLDLEMLCLKEEAKFERNRPKGVPLKTSQFFQCSLDDDNKLSFMVDYGPTNGPAYPSAFFILGQDDSLDFIVLMYDDRYMIELAKALTEKLGPPFTSGSALSPVFIWEDSTGTKIEIASNRPDIRSEPGASGTAIFKSAHWIKKEESEAKARSQEVLKNL